jgi:hypothetical protein
MSIREVITTINEMEKDGVISRYAIGGAVGAAFYLEPVATLDVDVFVPIEASSTGIVSISHILDYLTQRGGVIENEYVVIAGFPVQILPPATPLVEEALAEAVVKDVDGTPARVFTAEHLAAIALQLGRAKDKTRVAQFVEEEALDLTRFESILARHRLIPKWQNLKKALLES